MKFFAKSAALAAFLAFLAHAPAAAQMMGESSGTVDTQRRQYLGTVYTDVEARVQEWKQSLETDDLRRVMQHYSDDAMIVPAGGAAVKGKRAVTAAVDSLLKATRGYQTRMTDFSASGEMAYYAGRYTYFVDLPGGESNIREGNFVLVLYQEGRSWRIRSYVEAPDVLPAAAPAGG
jgi:ketosteroid isomerase-like protein